MDNVVTIEHRGMSGELAAGDVVTVESSEPGVLRLRRSWVLPPAVVTIEPLSPTQSEGGEHVDS
jgi:hypothetical protein